MRPRGFSSAGAAGATDATLSGGSLRRALAVVAVAALALGFSGRPLDLAAAADSDGDGVPDDIERDGVAGEPLLDFPAYAADPAVPDVFVQMDWVSCDPIVEYCGPNASLDRNRMTSQAAAEMAVYFAPEVSVHVDNGVPAPTPELASVHGAWGGAHRLPPGPQTCNRGSLGARFGYFHRGTVAGIGGGGGGVLYGYCFGASSDRGAVAAHELGHNFGLDHGGNEGSYPANCKPHYRSPMNYAYLYDGSLSQFSRGQRALTLNPTALDEQRGVGSDDPAVLDSLRGGPWFLDVSDDGAVDWNRNGRIDPEPVRAPITWASASCDQSTAQVDFFAPVREPSMIWLPAPEQARMYLFARGQDDRRPGYHVATRVGDCRPTDQPGSCSDWSPDELVSVPDAPAGAGAVALAAWPQDDGSGGATLVAIYADGDGQLYEQTLTYAGAESWSTPRPIEGARSDGSPALTLAPGDDTLVLMAPLGGTLWARERARGGGAWSEPVEQRWDDGGAIAPCHGPALTRGYERGREGEAIYAAIPAGPLCQLELARRGADGRWARLTEPMWAGPGPNAGGRPGLAYVPITPDVPSEGRFYVAWKPLPTGAGLIAFTTGNDPDPAAETRRMEFLPGAYMRNLWAIVVDGVALHYDPRYDANLRAAWVYLHGGLQLLPFADGIIDVDMYDQDDYEYIRANLACSLTASCER
ncbi:hypothetical protein [Haliangium sp.]|uniref:hypothetical protein n=1 Tax=Haliangium sp. TaxID=2663208 RepID=UPI003D0E0C2C